MIRFDRTISIGNMLTAVMVTLAILGSAFHIAARITAVEVKVDAMWSQYQNNVSAGR